jgi:hypothetical protein
MDSAALIARMHVVEEGQSGLRELRARSGRVEAELSGLQAHLEQMGIASPTKSSSRGGSIAGGTAPTAVGANSGRGGAGQQPSSRLGHSDLPSSRPGGLSLPYESDLESTGSGHLVSHFDVARATARGPLGPEDSSPAPRLEPAAMASSSAMVQARLQQLESKAADAEFQLGKVAKGHAASQALVFRVNRLEECVRPESG